MSLIKALKTSRDPEALWRSHGWGPKLSFPTSRSDGKSLALTLRLPLGWEKCDVLAMPEEVAAKPGSLAQAIAAIGTVADRSGVITVLGLARPIKRDVHLLATVTIALADVPGSPPESVAGAEVTPVEFQDPAGDYRGTRIRQMQIREVLAGQPALSFLTVQFMLETEHGWLVITFATPQPDVFTEIESVFDKIADFVRLAPAS